MWISFKEFVLQVVDGGFWWTSGSSGDFRERSISLKDRALLFLASLIQREHSIKLLLSYFIMVLIVPFLKPKLLKQHKTNLEQYSLATTSTANSSTFQPLFSETLFRGMYILTLVLCQASMFSSHGQVTSMAITLFTLLEKIVMSGLSWVNAMWGERKRCCLGPLTRPSLMPDVMSYWEKTVYF